MAVNALLIERLYTAVLSGRGGNTNDPFQWWDFRKYLLHLLYYKKIMKKELINS